MRYRVLGKTGLQVSELGLGGEWLERQSYDACKAIIDRCADHGINILDCWMSEPNVRSNIGRAIHENRDRWIIQGHFCSVWENGQCGRTRELSRVEPAFRDLLTRMQTDYIDLGMIHYVDSVADWNGILHSDLLPYILRCREEGTIRHVGISTHNPVIARLAAESGFVEMLLFSVNPVFDLIPDAFASLLQAVQVAHFAEDYASTDGIAAERAGLYRLCEEKGVGITVMKSFAGGRLLDAARSPFGVALTPLQCVHYALTRPAVASVLVGFDSPAQVDDVIRYETASEEEKDYTIPLAGATYRAEGNQCTYCGHCQPCPKGIEICMVNKLYDLATIQRSIPASIREHYRALRSNASDCIGCRACEARCPFHVPVAERMKQIAALFESNPSESEGGTP